MTGCFREKLSGVLRYYGVDKRLLLAVESAYSCSEIVTWPQGSKIMTFHRGCWIPPTRVYATTPLHSLYQGGQQTDRDRPVDRRVSAGRSRLILH